MVKPGIRSAVLAVALALALPAGASAKKVVYGGTTDGDGKIAFDVKIDKKGKPKKVRAVRFTNIPLKCDISGSVSRGSNSFGNGRVPVIDRRFAAEVRQAGFGNRTTIAGRFATKRLIKGTLDYDWHYPAMPDNPATPANEALPEEDCVAKLDYTAKRGGPDVELPAARMGRARRAG